MIEVTLLLGNEMNFSFYWWCKSSATCCRGIMLTDGDALFTICPISDIPRWFRKKGIDKISKEDGSTASSKDELKTLLLQWRVSFFFCLAVLGKLYINSFLNNLTTIESTKTSYTNVIILGLLLLSIRMLCTVRLSHSIIYILLLLPFLTRTRSS